VNCRRFASWYKDGEPADMSPTDSQVGHTTVPGHPRLGNGDATCLHDHLALDHPCTAAHLQVLIQDGYLLEGTLCKKTLGASGGSLVHIIFMEAGPEAARAFLSQCQYTANYWLLQHGFSIGIGDTVADGTTMLVINQTINRVSSTGTAYALASTQWWLACALNVADSALCFHHWCSCRQRRR
jgi:hypothetical protein